jgi:hypothetical protein
MQGRARFGFGGGGHREGRKDRKDEGIAPARRDTNDGGRARRKQASSFLIRAGFVIRICCSTLASRGAPSIGPGSMASLALGRNNNSRLPEAPRRCATLRLGLPTFAPSELVAPFEGELRTPHERGACKAEIDFAPSELRSWESSVSQGFALGWRVSGLGPEEPASRWKKGLPAAVLNPQSQIIDPRSPDTPGTGTAADDAAEPVPLRRTPSRNSAAEGATRGAAEDATRGAVRRAYATGAAGLGAV